MYTKTQGITITICNSDNMDEQEGAVGYEVNLFQDSLLVTLSFRTADHAEGFAAVCSDPRSNLLFTTMCVALRCEKERGGPLSTRTNNMAYLLRCFGCVRVHVARRARPCNIFTGEVWCDVLEYVKTDARPSFANRFANFFGA